MIEVRAYTDRAGRNLFDRWYDRLDDTTASRIAIALGRMENGNLIAKSVGAGVMELRLDFGPGYRIYFGRDGETLVLLLCGGTKRHQQDDIARAKQLWQEYKQHKGEK